MMKIIIPFFCILLGLSSYTTYAQAQWNLDSDISTTNHVGIGIGDPISNLHVEDYSSSLIWPAITLHLIEKDKEISTIKTEKQELKEIQKNQQEIINQLIDRIEKLENQ